MIFMLFYFVIRHCNNMSQLYCKKHICAAILCMLIFETKPLGFIPSINFKEICIWSASLSFEASPYFFSDSSRCNLCLLQMFILWHLQSGKWPRTRGLNLSSSHLLSRPDGRTMVGFVEDRQNTALQMCWACARLLPHYKEPEGNAKEEGSGS